MRQQAVNAALHLRLHRIEEFIDWRANGDDHWTGMADRIGRRRKEQFIIGKRLGEKRRCAMLDEWQFARFQSRERVFIEIVDVDRQTGLSKSQHKGNTDMAGATDDGHVGDLRTCRTGRRRFCRCNIQWIPLSPERANIQQIAAARPGLTLNALIGPVSRHLATKFQRPGNSQICRRRGC